MYSTLKKLCLLDGTSGREDAVREYIISQLGDNEYRVDALGNLIVSVRGKQRAKNRVMLCAHMDEVGVIVTYVTTDGYIKFTNVGGIRVSALAGKSVRFENGTYGVIGLVPVHLLPAGEKDVMPAPDSLYIDIGTDSREKTLNYVQPGDTAVFSAEYTETGDKILSKAIDDRAGCAVMLDMIKTGVEYDTVFCFNVQEEVGLRGAVTSTYSVAPDYAVVLESTTASDLAGVKDEKRVCVLGDGAAVGFMDNATVYDKNLYKAAFETAAEYGIKIQTKTAVAGGNDAGSVHKSRGGVKTLTVNVPCRYIHSPSCMCDKNDLYAVRQLAEKLAERFANE